MNTAFVWQALALVALVVGLAAWRWHTRREAVTRAAVRDLAAGLVGLVLAFGLVTGWRGVAGAHSEDNCVPSPHGPVCQE